MAICPYCKEEKKYLLRNPMIVFDPKTGKEKEDYICKDCLEFTLQELGFENEDDEQEWW